MNQRELDRRYMERALELARLGQGWVEPNPMVGCVIAHGPEVVGEGWHQRFGGAHAEVEALREAGQRARGATLYVTLEPCCHQGKTPPCTEAILAAGVQRVVAAMKDPFPQVAGQGLRRLAEAGLEVHCGLLEAEARRLNAPYLKLIQTGRPWVIAKWAMTLDGKLATRTGQSRWISGPESRALVHQLRGRVDAVLVGSRTAALDDPLLTARPPGPRTAVRIVVDGRARLASESQLVRTARQAPVLVAAGPEAAAVDLRRLESAGCEVFVAPGPRQVVPHVAAQHEGHAVVAQAAGAPARIDHAAQQQAVGAGGHRQGGQRLGGLAGQHVGERRLMHGQAQAGGEQALAAPDDGKMDDPVGELIHAALSRVSCLLGKTRARSGLAAHGPADPNNFLTNTDSTEASVTRHRGNQIIFRGVKLLAAQAARRCPGRARLVNRAHFRHNDRASVPPRTHAVLPHSAPRAPAPGIPRPGVHPG
ncbi:MAG TPA: bifunctional diaminohydroxyphosphoribosylaminopyrimidine deaminase/5-amino-6-(5-phosphoribosylamino)uracil reductase RibD, partial [Thermoguttaceae bacterium]|nr:bifunctional diaminohydroxyphosphoribosylaminopyrimidine deaminase/5-amino-6-(5-phosphoribosylamino)uracil reductase RibD [Thermoguttaceae bacterium]